ncbi:MAG TPA: 2,3-diaminopropionate biosynthesis protein SbnB, partial [Blastocatellia bacterium]
SAFNVVDDADHVSREGTSIHLTERLVGNRDFINCQIGDLLTGNTSVERGDESLTIFSPFGLGILDIAVGHFVYEAATREGIGTSIDSFMPRPWVDRALNTRELTRH